MKLIVNIILGIMAAWFVLNSFIIDRQSVSAIHQILGSMEGIKFLLVILTLAVVNSGNSNTVKSESKSKPKKKLLDTDELIGLGGILIAVAFVIFAIGKIFFGI